MREVKDLIAAWRALPEGGRAVLATVVATTGSTYRKPGARMLVTETGWVAGSVSGGCLEGDVQKSAWERTENGPALVTYDSTAGDDIVWGFGLGCRGSVTVLFERINRAGGPLKVLEECVRLREPRVLATVLAEGPELGQGWSDGEPPDPRNPIFRRAAELEGLEGCFIESIDGRPVLFECLRPPLGITIFGAGHDAIPLVAAAHGLGWHVTVADHRAAFATPERFPGVDRLCVAPAEALVAETAPEAGGAAVVMTHHFLTDRTILGELLRLPLSYVGQLGPRLRTEQILRELAEEGWTYSEAQREKLHAPTGLDIGSGAPEVIAVAIVAEILAVSATKSAAMLNRGEGPIHPVTAENRESPRCQALA